jgi:hypothetical protein
MIEYVVLPECPEIEREDSLIDHINQYETPGKN